MELSELMMLGDKEKLKYLREHDTELEQDSKLDILKSIRNSDLKIEGISDNNITLNLTLKFKYLIWLAEGNIPIDNYGFKLESIYEQFFKDSNDEERMKCINLDINDTQEFKVKVVESLEDDQLKVDYIENSDKLDVELSQSGRVQIIKSLKSDQLKVDYLEKFDSEFNEYNRSEIISSFSEDNFKIEYLEKFRNEFSSMAIAMIVKRIKDEPLKISCLERYKDRCYPYGMAIILKTLTDDEFKLNFIRTDEHFISMRPFSRDRALVIKSLLDDRLKMDCLTSSEFEFDSDDKKEIIETLIDEQMKVECLANSDIDLKLSDKALIVRSLTDNQLKIDCLSNSDINLESYDKGKTIRLLPEEQSRIDCLTDPKINLEPSDKARVISSLESDEVKLNYMEDSSMGFSKQDRLLIICSLQDEKKFEKFGIFPDESYRIGIDLPSNMTIGLELEAEGPNAEILNSIGKVLSGWEATYDGSLKQGVEVISPILHSTEEDMYSLARVCDIMQRIGLNTSERCGGHIHFGADFFGSDPKIWENFYTIYSECEEIFYKMSNATGEVPRSDIGSYATISNKAFVKMFKTGEVSIKTQEEFNQVIKELKDTRHRGVNVTNLGKDGKNTIEFRMPNGTIRTKVVRENINLFGSLLQVSKLIALDPEYRREEFEALKQKDLTEKEKTEALLDILFDDEEEKDIYRERWDAVKDNKTFEALKAENPTFIRGDYSMKKQSEGFFREVSAEDRANFLQNIKREIDNSRDNTIEEQGI